MKYDLSFVDLNFKPIDEIEKSIKLLDYDCKESVCILRRCCQTFVNIIGKIKDVKLENNLTNHINILKSNEIINDDIYFKLSFVESEFIKLQSLNYTLNKEIAQKCLDNTYEFIKWCFNGDEKDEEVDSQNNETTYKKVVFTNEDLNVFDDYLEIKKLLFLGKKFIECDKNDLKYSPGNSMTNSRKVVEYMVNKIQNKYNIKTNKNLKGKINSLEVLIPREIYYKMTMLIDASNIWLGYDNSVSDNEEEAIMCLNVTYEVAK